MPLIDVDIHESLSGLADLVPHLLEPWPGGSRRVPGVGSARPFCYASLGNGNPADIASDDGSLTASDYRLMRGRSC